MARPRFEPSTATCNGPKSRDLLSKTFLLSAEIQRPPINHGEQALARGFAPSALLPKGQCAHYSKAVSLSRNYAIDFFIPRGNQKHNESRYFEAQESRSSEYLHNPVLRSRHSIHET